MFCFKLSELLVCSKLCYTCADSLGPWKVFFWLGAESSKDETGTAALKAIELDEVMGGSCPHSREVQGHESEAFQELFVDYGGIQYLDGGVDSAFVKVERDVYPTRLLHCKGNFIQFETISSSYLVKERRMFV